MKAMSKIQEKRFAPCETVEKSIEIYKAEVREINRNNYSEDERKERKELAKLLCYYRVDISSPLVIQKKLIQIPLLMTKQQEERLEKLVKKYDDPKKLNAVFAPKGVVAKVKRFIGEIMVLLMFPADQISRLTSREIVGNPVYKHTLGIYAIHRQLETGLRQADIELTDELMRERIPKDKKPGLNSYFDPSKVDKTEIEKDDQQPLMPLCR
jgi:hypothetical protein